MEAENTVMTKEQINKVAFTNPLLIAQKQAKISFKAGYNQGVKNHHKACKMDYDAGIKEVVEWVKEHENSKFIDNYLLIPKKEWQQKLKEWGIKD